MPPGGDWLLSTSWTNAAEGGYIIEVELGPGYSDDRNYNNRATRAIIVGKHPFLIGGFVVWRKIRESRTEFKYVCKVILENISSVTVEDVQLELLEVSSNMTIIDGNVTFGYIEAGESAAGDDTCVFDVNRAEPIEPTQIRWQATYKRTDTGESVEQISISIVLLESESLAIGDITGEGAVNMDDLLIMARDWLQSGSIADIYPPPPNGDDIVNLKDFAVLAENWLSGP
ncbi:hypothetical protein ES703_108623 [subsurface metagenome]